MRAQEERAWYMPKPARRQIQRRGRNTARLRVILIDECGLRQRGVFIAGAVVQSDTRRDAELVLSIEAEIANRGVHDRIAEPLRVRGPMLSAARIAGKIQRKIRYVREIVGSEPVDQNIGVIVAIGDIDAEFERVLAARPGKIVGKLEALFARLDPWNRTRPCAEVGPAGD